MYRFSTLALAVLMSGPALWQAFVAGSMDPTTALIRFLIAVPVAGLLLALPRTIVEYYRDQPHPQTPVQAGAVRTDRESAD